MLGSYYFHRVVPPKYKIISKLYFTLIKLYALQNQWKTDRSIESSDLIFNYNIIGEI